jgi:hypothetical protein
VKKALVLLGLFLLMKPVFPLVDYVVNYDYISKVLCENKAKPELKCNGKCHLMKELAKASEEEKPTSSDKKMTHFEFETVFIQELPQFTWNDFGFSVPKAVNAAYSDLYCYKGSTSVFHPPTV